ncbi:methyltransferase domain-containing protein [Arsenicicoccus piscis]|nr:class I SAM-dependent methyltransferase [Arsenicicoccus piscis]MCH8628677.1 methyltransferase domain-containing protein [Arsenicicoccus piscis]
MASFVTGRDHWLTREGLLRNVVRQEVVRRQLEVHLPLADAGTTALDVGAGQGTQALHLARAGFAVTAVEPDPEMRAAFQAALAQERPAVRRRVHLVAGSLEDLDTLGELGALGSDEGTYDVVCCHGVLMYLPDPNPAIRALGRRVAVDGILSVVARNSAAMAWRPAMRGDYAGAHALLDEVDRAARERRDPFYDNELGVKARADSLERLGAFFGGSRVAVEYWYGVRTFSDSVPVDTPVPESADELEEIIALETRLGRTDPYRRMGTLLHLVGRRGEGRGPQL